MNRYEHLTFPREQADFFVDSSRRAWIPDGSTLKNLTGYDTVGHEYGSVTMLGQGLHSTQQLKGALETVLLFGSTTDRGALHHFAFHHGPERARARNSVVSVMQQCPGMVFDLDTCGQQRQRIIGDLYAMDADAAVLVSLDPHLGSRDAQSTTEGILESVGVVKPKTVLAYDVHADHCAILQALQQDRPVNTVFYHGEGHIFYKTHDIAVCHADGEPARLVVFEEPPGEEKRGFNGRIRTHFVYVHGDLTGKPPIMRVHSSCTTADHGSDACDCSEQLTNTLAMIREYDGAGIIVHMDHDGMALGTVAKLWQTQLTLGGEADLLSVREKHLRIPPDVRNYTPFLSVVRRYLGIRQARIASNNLLKRKALEEGGIEVIGQWPLVPDVSKLNGRALEDMIAKEQSGAYLKFLLGSNL